MAVTSEHPFLTVIWGVLSFILMEGTFIGVRYLAAVGVVGTFSFPFFWIAIVCFGIVSFNLTLLVVFSNRIPCGGSVLCYRCVEVCEHSELR